jgi:hypothetical protein
MASTSRKQRRDRVRRWKARPGRAAPPFVEIVRAADLVGHGGPGCFELLLGDSIRILIPPDFDEAEFLRLVLALDGR